MVLRSFGNYPTPHWFSEFLHSVDTLKLIGSASFFVRSVNIPRLISSASFLIHLLSILTLVGSGSVGGQEAI